MASGAVRFDDFAFDPGDRRLRRGGAAIALNARYLDALALLVREAGSLVTKERFLAEVWRGVPVTDEALTQCIRTLRKELGDDAARPRIIETVPKHGYRFIAVIEPAADVSRDAAAAPRAESPALRGALALAAAGTAGAGVAGLAGGVFYGAIAAAQVPAGGGAISALLVLVCVTLAMALIGGAGVSLAIAAAALATGRTSGWSVLAAAAGGLLTGAVVRLVGLDAFNLLLGRAPEGMTGGAEGVLIGAAAGVGVWLGANGARPRRGVAAGALAGALAGVLIPLAGGRLMGGSLALLAEQFPGSRLRLEAIGALFGEAGFGPTASVATAAAEAALFAASVVAAMALVQRRGAAAAVSLPPRAP